LEVSFVECKGCRINAHSQRDHPSVNEPSVNEPPLSVRVRCHSHHKAEMCLLTYRKASRSVNQNEAEEEAKRATRSSFLVRGPETFPVPCLSFRCRQRQAGDWLRWGWFLVACVACYNSTCLLRLRYCSWLAACYLVIYRGSQLRGVWSVQLKSSLSLVCCISNPRDASRSGQRCALRHGPLMPRLIPRPFAP